MLLQNKSLFKTWVWKKLEAQAVWPVDLGENSNNFFGQISPKVLPKLILSDFSKKRIAQGFEKSPKQQNIAQTGHTAGDRA